MTNANLISNFLLYACFVDYPFTVNRLITGDLNVPQYKKYWELIHVGQVTYIMFPMRYTWEILLLYVQPLYHFGS